MMNLNLTDTVKQLLIINIIFFIGSLIVGNAATDILALHSPQNDKFYFWQPLTHMFMHGGFMHIFFNMFALVSFGSLLERIWGGKKFLFFYISCGLGAAALHIGVNYLEIQSVLDGASDLHLSAETLHQILNVSFDDGHSFRDDMFKKEIIPILQNVGKLQLINQENYNSLFEAAVKNQIPAVGASGAIYGIMVAFAFLAPNAELMMMFIPVPIKAKYFVPGLVAIDLFLGLKGESIFGGGGTGVAHFAHIGGAIVGFIMMWYWKKNSYNNKRWN